MRNDILHPAFHQLGNLVRPIIVAMNVLVACVSLSAFAQGGKPPGNPFQQAVRVQPYMEPAIRHAAQDSEVRAKLERVKKASGRAPNILILLVDDMGWGTRGFMAAGRRLVRRRQT